MPRFLCAALLIALAALSGCGGSDDPKTAEAPAETIDVDLEGTWASEVIINEAEAAKADPNAVEVIKSMKMEMTFTPDGKLQLAGETGGQSYDAENQWSLVDMQDNVLKIKSITPEGKEKDLEFFFNDSNSFDMPLNLETAQVGALRFTRVR
jgi:hypothetical protein